MNELRHVVAAAAVGLLTLLAPPPAAAAVDPSYSGSWYNAAEAGAGFNLEIFSDERALLFWYTYDDAGEAVWLYSEGKLAAQSIDFTVYYADGMKFSDLRAADKVNRKWGTLKMTFADCNNATISYASTLAGLPHSPVGTRTLTVQRLVNIATLPCRREVSGYWEGRHFDPTLAGGQGAWADLSGVLAPDGAMYLVSDDSGEVFLGTYAGAGGSAAFDYQVCDDGTSDCVDGAGTATYRNKYFARGQGTTPTWGTQPFELSYRTVYDQPATLASLAGNYTLVNAGVTYTVAIAADGTLTGSDTRGCLYDGNLMAYDVLSQSNTFSYQGLLQGCGDTEEWVGVVINLDEAPGDRRLLQFILDTGDGAVSFRLRR